MASQSGSEGPWPTGARWRVLGVNPGCGFSAGGGGADPGESGCGLSASGRGAADLGRPRGGGFFRWSLPLALPCGPCACCRSCLVALRFAVTSRRWMGVVVTLLSAAWPPLLLRPSPSLRRPVHRRALAGALGTGQCAAAPCQAVGSVVGVVAASQRAVEARVEGGGLGGQLWSSGSAAGHPVAIRRRLLGRQLCVASCAGRTRPPLAAASTVQP